MVSLVPKLLLEGVREFDTEIRISTTALARVRFAGFQGSEADAGFSQVSFGGLGVADACGGVSALVILEFLGRAIEQLVQREPLKPPCLNDVADGRPDLADGQLRVFPPSAALG